MTPIAKAADTPFSGKYCTLARLLDWITGHPGFRPKSYYEKRSRDIAEEREFFENLKQAALRSGQKARSFNRRHRTA